MANRIMALDVGDKWIGMAVSDEMGLIAQTLPRIKRRGFVDDAQVVRSVAQEWQVTKVVVGLPLNMNASVGPQAEKTLRFAGVLRTVCAMPVVTWDERLTTRQAERMLIGQDVRRERRQAVIDGVAAALILQGYLDHERGAKGGESDG